MSYLAPKAIIGVLTAGALGAGGYLTYNSFSIKTIGDELLSENSENSENRLLGNDDSKWGTREDKYRGNPTDGTSLSKIEGLDLGSDVSAGTEKGRRLREKCNDLWKESKGVSNAELRKKELRDWCLENSNQADSSS